MRTVVTPEDEELLVKMYINKNSFKSIAKKTGYSEKDVRDIIKRSYKKDENHHIRYNYTSDEKMNMIVSLYRRGYTPANIHNILSLNYDIIWVVLGNHDIMDNPMCYRKNITVSKINSFRDTISIGDRFKIVSQRDIEFDNLSGMSSRPIIVTVLKKYPHFVMTDLGDFMYLDLYNGRKL